MAKLKQHKIEGTYYTRLYMGGLVTRQIHPDGVAHLKRGGVRLDGEIPSHLMSDLMARNWLFTKDEMHQWGEVNWAPHWHMIGSPERKAKPFSPTNPFDKKQASTGSPTGKQKTKTVVGNRVPGPVESEKDGSSPSTRRADSKRAGKSVQRTARRTAGLAKGAPAQAMSVKAATAPQGKSRKTSGASKHHGDLVEGAKGKVRSNLNTLESASANSGTRAQLSQKESGFPSESSKPLHPLSTPIDGFNAILDSPPTAAKVDSERVSHPEEKHDGHGGLAALLAEERERNLRIQPNERFLRGSGQYLRREVTVSIRSLLSLLILFGTIVAAMVMMIAVK